MIDYEYEPLFRQNSVKKDFTITDGDSINIDNSDIYSESISLKESLCSEKTLIFGSCEAACFKFTTSDTADVFKNKKLRVMVSLDNHTSDPFLYGSYTVVEETLTADRKRKEIVAYDDIYVIHNTNVADYYNNLIYPVTLKTFRDGFFSFLNIPCEVTTLVNDNMIVEKTIDVQMLSGTDVAKAICEINGVMGHIDRNGVFRFVKLDTPGENLNTYPYYQTTMDHNGIRFTDNGDGTITANRISTSTSTSNFFFHSRGTSTTNKLVLPNGRYKVSGCPSGGATNKYFVGYGRTHNNAFETLANDIGNGAIIELNGDDNSDTEVTLQIAITITRNYSPSDLVFDVKIERIPYEITPSIYKNPLEYADYTVQSITQLQIRQEENDIGVIVGTTGNSYIIEDNFLVYGKGTEELTPIANNLLSQIEGISYKPCKIDCIGNPCFEVGDRFTVTKKDNTTFSSYLLERNLKGLQALFDSIVAEGEEYYSEDVNGIHYEIQQLKGKSNVLERTIEETRSTISDVAAGLQTEIRQTAEGIEIQIQDLQDQIDGAIEYYERDGTPTLLNYPYWDFTSAFKCDGTKRCDAIYDDAMVEGGDQYPHFYYSEADRRNHQRDLCFDNLNAVSYRFNYVEGQWIWQEIADSETSVILSRLSTLEATAETLQSEYTEISLELSDNYYTKVQTDSKISQTASQIQTTVSATYATKTTTNSLQTQITQNATAITAKASKTGGSASSFAYELTDSKFVLKSNNKTVLTCDANGLSVDGTIKSTSTINGARLVGCVFDGQTTFSQQASFGSLYVTGFSQLSSMSTGSINCFGSLVVSNSIDCRDITVGSRRFMPEYFSTEQVKVVRSYTRSYSSALGGYYISDLSTDNITVVKNPSSRMFMGAI